MMEKGMKGARDAGSRSGYEAKVRMMERGVSQRQIDDVTEWKRVRSSRSVGNGSDVMRQQALGSLSSIGGMMGPRGLEAFQDDFVSATVGAEKVRTYFPEEDRKAIPTDDAWMASRENADMLNGVPGMITEGQNHEVHAEEHLKGGFAGVI